MRTTTLSCMMMIAGLSACGVADVTNGATTQSASTSTTGGSGTGSTTDGGGGGTTIGGTTTGGTTGTQNPNTVDPNNGSQNPNSTLDANTIPQNVFFNIVSNSNNAADGNVADGNTTSGDGNVLAGATGDTNTIVLVFSTRADYCSALNANEVPSSSVNVRLEAVQTVPGFIAGSYQASQGVEEVVGAQPTCVDTSSTALQASFFLGASNSRGNNTTLPVSAIITLQGAQQQSQLMTAMKCSAITTTNTVAATQASGGKCIN